MQQNWPAVLTRPDEYLAALRSISQAFGMVGNPLPTSFESGVEVNVIRGWLGHADLSTTNRYAEINTKAKLEALRSLEPPGTSAGSRIKPIWQSDESLLNWLASL